MKVQQRHLCSPVTELMVYILENASTATFEAVDRAGRPKIQSADKELGTITLLLLFSPILCNYR